MTTTGKKSGALDLTHEPACKDDGTPYQPYFLDDTGKIQGYQGFLCRLCHAYYANPEVPPVHSEVFVGVNPDSSYPGRCAEYLDVFTSLPPLSGQSVCPAKLYELLKEKVL
jgi:hypothetical protein